ncbi:MAG TPA: hypothetical protein VG944_24325, partial [Fimbriimonas sp.]|nr:hypothetical protein [Fimbriimonas sp.]
GGLAGAWFAKSGMQGMSATVLILLATMAGGAAWAWIAGWLQVKRGVEAVISTILLNFIALEVLEWAIHGPLQEANKSLPQTDSLGRATMLYRPDRQMDLNAGSLIAVMAAVVVFVYLYRTQAGLKLRVTGDNPDAARANRIDAGKAKIQAFLVSGALCGLAGGVEYAGSAGLIGKGFSQNWGFLGIPVALLSGLHPLVAIVSALYFGALMAGSENLGRFTSGGSTLVFVVQAAAVLAFVAVGQIRLPARRSPSIQ